MKIDSQVKISDKLNAKVNKFFAEKESLIEEVETRKDFLYTFLMDYYKSKSKLSHEDTMKYEKLFKEHDFLTKTLDKLTK